MVNRRHSHGCRLYTALGELLDRREGAAAKLGSGGLRPRELRIDHPCQAHRLALLGELVVDPGVIAPEGAGAGYDDVDEVIWQAFELNHRAH